MSVLLHLVPFLALLLPLLLRRYPGERRLSALVARRRRTNRSRAPRASRGVGRSLVLARAGVGEVLAFELAGRAPPLPR
jgi:hypothetical protein